MDIIFSASIIASFFAGMVALFAPCCITVLLPAYLASAFREKKHIVKMTFIFFAGIAVVLIPIGLGAASLAQLFRSFHKELYIIGGVIMVALAALSVSGKGVTLFPMPKRLTPNANLTHPKSVFILGIFSGAATSCCAPVLAGAVTLAVISGTFWKALIVTFSYVFGMVFPLFIAAYAYDHWKIEQSKIVQGKILNIKLGAKTVSVHSTNVLAGAIFLIMGIILLVLAFAGNAFWAPSFQVQIGQALNRWSANVFDMLSIVPDLVWGGIILGIFFFLLYKAKNKSTNHYNEH